MTEARFRDACRLHSEALYAYAFTIGPARESSDDSARRTAEFAMRERGWTLDQLSHYSATPEELPWKCPKATDEAAWSVVDRVFRRLARQVPPRPDALDHVKDEYLQDLLARFPGKS